MASDDSPASTSSLATRLARAARTEVLLTAWRFGLYTPPDRKILDGVILPSYATRAGFERVLFVGVKAYNEGNRAIFAGRRYATLDPNPAFAVHGAEEHVVAGLEDVARHFAEGAFDVVVVNGVIGYGLDAPALVERALLGAATVLRPRGELVVGVNDERPATPPIARVAALGPDGPFEPVVFAPLGTACHVVETPLRERTHTFRFYAKRA